MEVGKGRIPEDRGLKAHPGLCLQEHLVESILVGEGLRTLSTLGEGVETPRPHFPPLSRATPNDSPYQGMGMGMDMDMDMDIGPAVAGRQ